MSAGEPRGQRLAIIGAALLVVALVLLTGGKPDRAELERPSTMLLGDGGAKALFDVAGVLGLAPRAWMRPLTRLDEEAEGVMVLLEPEQPLEAPEIAALKRFVERGGSLVYAPGRDDELDGGLLDALDLGGGEEGTEDGTEDDAEGDEEEAVLLLECGPQLEFTMVEEPSWWGERLLADQDGPVRGFQRAFTGLASAAVEPLLVAPDDLVGVARVSRPGPASGTILLVADVAGLTNSAIARSGLAPIVLRACADLRGEGSLWFDEYHHGFDETGSVLGVTWGWLTGARVGNAVLALAIVGLFAAAWAGRRFGAPIPRPPAERRSALEHVEALARAWQRNRATRRPRELLIEGLRMRLGGAAELAPMAELAKAAQDASPSADPIELARRIDELLANRTQAEASRGGAH